VIAGPSQPSATPGERIVGLDLWRAMLMTAGLLVHGSLWLETRDLFAWTNYLSSGTRMGVFFAIAGFLAARGLQGRTLRGWCEHRLTRLLPPTIFGLAVICPTIALLYAAHTGEGAHFAVEAAKLHHLWFMVALCLYTVAAAAYPPLVARLDRVRELPLPVLLLATAFAGVLLASLVHLVLGADGRTGPLWEERRMIVFLPVFVMGLALGRCDLSIWHGSGGSSVPLAVLIGVFGWPVLAHALGCDPGVGGIAGDIDDILRMAVSPPAAALLVLRSAATIRRVPAWLDRAVAAALTLYLLHVPLIMVAHLAMTPLRLDPHIQFLVAVLSSGIAAYQLHHRVVARTPWLAFAINGVPLPRRHLPVALPA